MKTYMSTPLTYLASIIATVTKEHFSRQQRLLQEILSTNSDEHSWSVWQNHVISDITGETITKTIFRSVEDSGLGQDALMPGGKILKRMSCFLKSGARILKCLVFCTMSYTPTRANTADNKYEENYIGGKASSCAIILSFRRGLIHENC